VADWSKFLLILAIVSVLAAADVLLLRPGRSLSFWIRACGFEVCTVFAATGTARYLFDLLAIGPLVERGG
jgi:hypothetical protein